MGDPFEEMKLSMDATPEVRTSKNEAKPKDVAEEEALDSILLTLQSTTTPTTPEQAYSFPSPPDPEQEACRVSGKQVQPLALLSKGS